MSEQYTYTRDEFVSNLPPLASKAREFAVAAHGDQKYGPYLYVYHLDEVARAVASALGGVGATDEELATAYLHDVLEDTETSLSELVTEFGSTVAMAVFLCTDDSKEGDTRAKRKERTNLKLLHLNPQRQADQIALIVKPADRLANVTESIKSRDPRLEMYRREHEEFRKAAQRGSLGYRIWEVLERRLRTGEL